MRGGVFVVLGPTAALADRHRAANCAQVNEFLLYYIQNKTLDLELNRSHGTDYVTLATAAVPLFDLLEKPTSLQGPLRVLPRALGVARAPSQGLSASICPQQTAMVMFGFSWEVPRPPLFGNRRPPAATPSCRGMPQGSFSQLGTTGLGRRGGRTALELGETPPPPPSGRPAYAQPLSP